MQVLAYLNLFMGRLRFNHKLEKALANLQNNDDANKRISDIMMTANPSIPENTSDIDKITLDDKDKKQAKARAKNI